MSGTPDVAGEIRPALAMLQIVQLFNIADDVVKRSLPTVNAELKWAAYHRRLGAPANDFMAARKKILDQTADGSAEREAQLVELLTAPADLDWPKSKMGEADFPKATEKDPDNAKGVAQMRLTFLAAGLYEGEL